MGLHPRFGQYAEQQPTGVVDLEALETHPLVRGQFRLDARLGDNSRYRILNDERPDFELLVAERPDAQAIVDLLNLAIGHLDVEEA